MLVTVLPLTLAASAAQMWVSTYARSFKEAQLYLNLLMMVPMAPASCTVAHADEVGAVDVRVFAVLGQEVAGGRGAARRMLRPLPFLLASASSVAVALVALRAVTRLLGDGASSSGQAEGGADESPGRLLRPQGPPAWMT